MAIRTILRWNDDWRSNVSGYRVTIDGGAAVDVPSAGFVDPASYVDQAAADAVAYVVSTALDAAVPLDAFDPADAAVLTVRKRSFNTASVDFCTVSGSVLPPDGVSAQRSEVRVEVASGDRPARYSTAGYLGGTSIFKTNHRGEFALPLPRGAAVLLHIPATETALRFVVPATATANLADLAVEFYDLHRNN